MMRIILLAAALAADLPSTKAAPALVDADRTMNWSGFYAGVDGGYAWSSTNVGKQALRMTYGALPDMQGGFASLHAGYRWQTPGNLVFGLEAFVLPGGASSDIGIAGVSHLKTTTNLAGGANARVGIASGQWLSYAAVGVAVAQDRASGFNPSYPNGFGADAVHTGLSVGAGVEYAFAQNWSARGQFIYTFFNSQPYLGNQRAADAGFGSLGVNYRFGQ